MSKQFFSEGHGSRSRRQSRAKRIDPTRLWREGLINEDGVQLERWSKEAKDVAPKVEKKSTIEDQIKWGDALVLQVNRRSCLILDSHSIERNCRYGPNLDLEKFSHLAVGDIVRIELGTGDLDGVIQKVLPRKNQLSRPGPEDRVNQELVLAANVDYVMLVFTAIMPEFNARLMDRYLALLEWMSLSPLICINKIELIEQLPPEIVYLSQLGYPIQMVSAKTGQGLDELRTILRGKNTVLTGPSGAGKSSLVRSLDPKIDARIGEVRDKDGKGRHTTTRSHLYHLQGEINLIDTPGLREINLAELEPSQLAELFIEFRPYLGKCRFRTCIHHLEPGCSILEQVEKGSIADFRYRSYLRILEHLDD